MGLLNIPCVLTTLVFKSKLLLASDLECDVVDFERLKCAQINCACYCFTWMVDRFLSLNNNMTEISWKAYVRVTHILIIKFKK